MDLSYLKPIYLFSELNDAELKKVASIADVKAIMPGQEIFNRGQDANAFYVVIMGSVKLSVGSNEGDEIQIRNLGSGSHFGEMAMLDGEKRSASVQAMEQTSLAEIPYDKFFALLNSDSIIAVKVYRSIAKYLAVRLRSTTTDLNQMKELKFHH